MTFRDMTFCAAKCANAECERRWTNELASKARAWMRDLVVAFCDFSPTCPDYQPEDDAR